MNWGKGVIIALAGFIGFIMYMVVQMYQNNIDLVEEDFYEQGTKIDNRVQATENALVYTNEFVVDQNADEIHVGFPKELDMENAKGIIHFYRPEKASLDKKYPIKTSNNIQIIDKSDLTLGNFIIKYIFTSGGKDYYIEKKIFVKK